MGHIRLLRLTSCQAQNSEFVGKALAGYLGGRLRMDTEFVGDMPWQRREQLLDEGAIHVGWICGLPYIHRSGRARPGIELLAAPVMLGARYGGRPVYFSDIVVRRDSAARTFDDLRGSRWAYNEPGSHSGYNIVRYQLARRGKSADFFAESIETGAHQATLRLILEGNADASAIDSTVLETEFRRNPVLRRHLCVIETWGPSPAPPWVVSHRVPAGLRRQLRSILLNMHCGVAGRAILRDARMSHFGGVLDSDYDPIRHMARAGADVML